MRIKKYFISLLSVFVIINLCFVNIKAGISFSGSTTLNLYEGSSSIITISLSDGAGRVNISSNNSNVATVNTSSQFLDNSSMTITIRAVKAGSTTVTISGTYSSYSNPGDQSFSRTITVNVYEKSNNNAPGNTPTPAKSSVKLLGSLSVENFSFEEEFNNSRTEYTLYVPFGTKSINIKATPASSKATLSAINGTVHEGWNTIEFVCTAEDGSKQTYTIKVYVEEKPDIYLNDGQYGVVKNTDKIKLPEGFEENVITIEDKEVKAFKNKGIYLLYLADQDMNKDFYIYDINEKRIISKYEPMLIDDENYISLEFNYEDFDYMLETYEPSTTYINDKKLNSWTSKATNTKDFKILYLLNENGDKQLFSYDIKEKTIQRFVYPIFLIEQVEVSFWEQYQNIICLSAAAAGVISLIAALITTSKDKKKHK